MTFDPAFQFYVGQDVVCVDDQVHLMGGSTAKDAAITEGEVYRIRWLGIVDHYVFGTYLGVKLVGVDSKFGEPWGMPDAPYKATRFRPVVSDPLAWARQIAADPNGFMPVTPEGPTRDVPVPEIEREDV